MDFLGVIAGFIGIGGYVPYVRDIIKGTTQPDRIAWLIWTFEYAVLFAAQFNSGGGSTLWIIGLQLIGVVAISGLSFHYGIGEFDLKSGVIFTFVCVALFLWYVTKNPILTIALLIAVEAVGTILTARKVYLYPGSETLTMWRLLSTAGLLGVISLGTNAESILYVYPAAIIAMGCTIVYVDRIARKQVRFNKPDDWSLVMNGRNFS